MGKQIRKIARVSEFRPRIKPPGTRQATTPLLAQLLRRERVLARIGELLRSAS